MPAGPVLALDTARGRPRTAAVLLPQAPAASDLEEAGVPVEWRPAIESTVQRPEITLAPGDRHVLYPAGPPDRLILAGLGPRDRLDLDAVRRAAAAVTKACLGCDVTSVRFYLPRPASVHTTPQELGRALGDGAAAGTVRFNDYRGAAGGDAKAPGTLKLAVPTPLRTGVERSLETAAGVATALRLAATPPNVAHPEYLATACREMAGEVGLKFSEVDHDEAKRLNMGGLLAVGRAGSAPPRVLVLEHPGTGRRGKPLLLVGKAVTFDTGGVSLKPTASMAGMKYDMCGGAAVLGAMEAVARLGVATRVVGLVPCAENLVDTTAYRVDDILTLCNGVTVEVTNTDAEGRLILADALAYGTRLYKPRAVVDLATLTGGVITALGDTAAGLFVNDHDLHRRLDIAAEAIGEGVWPLPLWDVHRKAMRGNHADLRNSADRKATPIQGAAFLSHFVGRDAPTAMPTVPWAHLDIAGVATREAASGNGGKDPTAFGVRLLSRFVESL